jgi:predicted alpha-1,2-mannosidase
MKKTFLVTLSLLFLTGICSSAKNLTPSNFVDPFIGTGDHGHVFIGAHVPFGAVQVGTTNYVKGWDWCSGYHYSDSIITGFTQTHLSGTGIGDLGDIHIMPYVGKIKLEPGTIEQPLSGYATLYSHADEVAKAGYYSIRLKQYGIKAELTATERVAYHQYTFPTTKEARVAVDLGRGIGWDGPTETYLKKVDELTYVGYRFSAGWAKDQRLYFAIKLSQPAQSLALYANNTLLTATEAKAKVVKLMLTFETSNAKPVTLKVGISPVSEENALLNIATEVGSRTFAQIQAAAAAKWNTELARVEVTTQNIHDARTFYTAMYHAFTAPALFNDCNGDYRGTDKKADSRIIQFSRYGILTGRLIRFTRLYNLSVWAI